MVSTIAGQSNTGSANGIGTVALFSNPHGVVVVNGLVYVCDYGNNVIRLVSTANVVSTFAGQMGVAGTTALDGIGTSSTFNLPYKITADSAGLTLYITEDHGNRIRKIIISSGLSTFLASLH